MRCYVCSAQALVKYKNVPYCNGCLPKDAYKQPEPKKIPDPHETPPLWPPVLTESECTGFMDPGENQKVCTKMSLCVVHKCTPTHCYCV